MPAGLRTQSRQFQRARCYKNGHDAPARAFASAARARAGSRFAVVKVQFVSSHTVYITEIDQVNAIQ